MSESIILILAFLLFFFIVFYLFKKPTKNTKSAVIKKDELIKSYENEMHEIINRYKNDSAQLQKKKIEYLKLASHQLHNNIFFDEQEAKQIIKRLASF